MKISLNSIKSLTPVTIPEAELKDFLSSHICNVEHIQDLAKKYEGILIGQIISSESHPSADKLGVYKLDIGNGLEVLVVAGDKSLKVGDKVAYFKPGSKVPYNAHPEKYDGIVQEVELRGVKSQGMLASAKELDISNSHESVLVLDTDKPAGTTFVDAYGLNDLIIDIENKGLTNRPECFGLIGLAREFAGIQGQKFVTPEWFRYWDRSKLDNSYASNLLETINPLVDTLKLNAAIESPDLCHRYMCVALDNVTIKPSPVWLQIELSKAGIRPINNVVDITNYLMIMTGQPLHAFDYDKIVNRAEHVEETEAGIVVRNAKKGEIITVIDGSQKELDDTMLVITDGVSPVAIAGVMGGYDSEISPSTTKIILESASFDMYNIRKTSNKTGIKSDAVTRYARSQDPHQCEAVLVKAVEMLKELSSAKVATRVIDLFPRPRVSRKIEIDLNKMNIKLGLSLSAEVVKRILENVELDVEIIGNKLQVSIPTYRQDLNIPEDIYEEVVRLYGYEKVQITLPTKTIEAASSNTIFTMADRIRRIMLSSGATELITYSFTSKTNIENSKQDVSKAYRLLNAQSNDLEYMRMAIVPSLLEKCSENMNDGFELMSLYEINKVHVKGESVGKYGQLGVDILPVERENPELPYEWRLFSMVVSLSDRLVSEKLAGSVYYQIKYYVDRLLSELKINNFEYTPLSKYSEKEIVEMPLWLSNALKMYVAGESAVLIITREGKKHYVGLLGKVDSQVRKSFAVAENTAGCELNIEELILSMGGKSSYIEPSKYPKVSQDYCFVTNISVPYQLIESAVSDVLSKSQDLIYAIEPVDIYKPENSEDSKQVTLRVVFRSKSRVLTESEILVIRESVVSAVQEKADAKLKE